jgi:hypothetical protein
VKPCWLASVPLTVAPETGCPPAVFSVTRTLTEWFPVALVPLLNVRDNGQIGVGVADGVFVAVRVGVFVGVLVGVDVTKLVGVRVGVFVGVLLGVLVGV